MMWLATRMGMAGVAGVLLLHTTVPSLVAQASGRPADGSLAVASKRPDEPGAADGARAPFAALVTNQTLAAAQRITAAQQWLAASDQLPTVRTVLDQITTLSLPDTATGLLNALAASRLPATAGAIVDHLPNFTPVVRRAAADVILRRPEWIRYVVDAVEQGKLARTEMPPVFWAKLIQDSDPALAARAAKLAGFKPESSGEAMAALTKKLLPAADQHGALPRGKELFDQLCLTCHTLDGKGGKIGFDLTGLGARPRADILRDVIDANRSVEADYRLWTVTTKGDDTWSGRLEVEQPDAIGLLDTTGEMHTVARKDIAKLEVSPLSVMPVGFEALPVSDLASLLDYLCASFPARAR